YVDARDVLGALDRLGDGFRGFVEVDDRAAAHATRLDIADAAGGERAVAPAHAVGLHDEAGDLRGAQVDGGDHRSADQRGLEAFTAVAALFLSAGVLFLNAGRQVQHPSVIRIIASQIPSAASWPGGGACLGLTATTSGLRRSIRSKPSSMIRERWSSCSSRISDCSSPTAGSWISE